MLLKRRIVNFGNRNILCPKALLIRLLRCNLVVTGDLITSVFDGDPKPRPKHLARQCVPPSCIAASAEPRFRYPPSYGTGVLLF